MSCDIDWVPSPADTALWRATAAFEYTHLPQGPGRATWLEPLVLAEVMDEALGY